MPYLQELVTLANLKLSTLLAVGACLQSVLFFILPRYVALLPALILLLKLGVETALITAGYLHNPYLPERARMNLVTAPIPNQDGMLSAKGADKGLVVFIIGATCNHPLGPLAPGFKDIGTQFDALWLDAAADTHEWGYMGHTGALLQQRADGGIMLVVISYWRNVEGLHAFAQAPLHRGTMNLWSKISKKSPHLGIFHETYCVEKGGWENIYHQIHPFGMGAIKYPIKGGNGETELLSSITDASKRWKGMLGRMAQRDL